MDATMHRRTYPLSVPSPAGPGPAHLRTGELGEDLACRHLVEDDALGIVARNWRVADGTLRGELDVVAVDATGCLVVCEVKTRRDAHRFGGALASVSPRKRAQVRALTAAYLRASGRSYRQVRLDVIAVDLGSEAQLTHLVAVL